MPALGTTLLYLVKYCSKSGLMLYHNDTAFLMQPSVLPTVNHELRFPFHASNTAFPNSSTELEHSSPHTSTPGDLCLAHVSSLLIPSTPPVWSGKVARWTSHRWYLGVTWYASSPPTVGIPSLSPDSRMSGLLSHHGRALSAATQERVMGGQFWDLSCLSENRLILILLGWQSSQVQDSDWRLFSSNLGVKSFLCISCMFHYCSWEVRFLILL